MARLFNDPTDPAAFTRVSLPIEKFESQDDGSVLVWGRATSGEVDRDQQIIDPAFARKSLSQWFSTGANVRVMHSPNLYPAGVGVELVSGEDGEWLKSRIVEPTAVKLVEAGVLQAYSVGIARPKIQRDMVAKGGRVVDGETVEVSLVDRPANPACGLMLAKMAGGDNPTVEFVEQLYYERDDDPVTFKPSELASMLVKLGKATGAVEKRDFDKGVGEHGVDRDKLPAEDFAGPDRTYPIESPKDVHDAATLIGKADDPDAVKRKIISIAHRKGAEFVAKLPDEWKKSEKGTEPELTGTATPEVTKSGKKDCANCGKSHDADSPAKFCSGCGHKLSAGKSDKAAKVDEPEDRADDDEDKSEKAAKSEKPDEAEDDDDKAGEEKPEKVDKAATADTEVEVGLEHLKDAIRGLIAEQGTDPDHESHVADHAVNADLDRLDADATTALADQHEDMRTDKAAEPDLTKAAHDGVPYGLRRLHDATCEAYAWAAVKAAHPSLVITGLDKVIGTSADMLHTFLAKALSTGPSAAGDVAELAKAYEAAATLTDPHAESLAQARAQMHRAFKAANMGEPGSNGEPAASLKPINTGENGHQPHAAQFVRGYISAGHAPLSSTGAKPRVPATHPVDAEQFRRGLIEGGHESDSPGNTHMGGHPATPSAGHGTTTPMRAPGEKAADAELHKSAEGMSVIHDRIAAIYPHMCPIDFAAPRTSDLSAQPLTAPANTLDTRPNATPATVQASATPDLIKSAMAVRPDLLKAAVAELVNEQVSIRLAEVDVKHAAEVAELTKKFEEFAASPDPRQAPIRGMAGMEQALQLLTKSATQEPPAEATVRKAQHIARWLDSPNPTDRETARAALRQIADGR